MIDVLQVNIAIILVYGLWFVFLRRTRTHSFQRFFLLSGLLISISLPFLPQAYWSPELIPNWQPQLMDPQEVSSTPAALAPEQTSISWIWLVYFTGVGLFTFRFLRNLTQLFLAVRALPSQKWRGYRIIFDSNPCPRSFFKLIFLSHSAWQSSQRDLLLAHESAHARFAHSFDLIFIQLLHILLWFNPFIILYRRALKEVHEYQADAYVQKQVGLKPYLDLLLEQSFRGDSPEFLSAWGSHLTQRRMFMLLQNPNLFRHLTLNSLAFGHSIILLASLYLAGGNNDPENWISPLKDYRITASFKDMKDPFSKEIKFHKGIDLAAPLGTEVLAPASGKVHELGDDESHGIYLVLAHPDGWMTIYNHLNETAPGLKAGDNVKQGSLIGKVGSTGRSTGPHLHYEIQKDGQNVDPKPYLK